MTDVHCTNCGRELEEFEDLVLVATGYVAQVMKNEYAAMECHQSPYIHTLCKTCAEGLEINGVVMEKALTQEDSDFCSVCGAVIGHLPGCPDGDAVIEEEVNPCEGCGNQGSTSLFGHLPPGDGLNLCRDVCEYGKEGG